MLLTGPSEFTPFSTPLTDGQSYALSLLAGSYVATISVNATGVAGGAYDVGITAPTPEPATLTLMVSGGLAAGFWARRRRRASARA